MCMCMCVCGWVVVCVWCACMRAWWAKQHPSARPSSCREVREPTHPCTHTPMHPPMHPPMYPYTHAPIHRLCSAWTWRPAKTCRSAKRVSSASRARRYFGQLVNGLFGWLVGQSVGWAISRSVAHWGISGVFGVGFCINHYRW